MNTLYGAIVSKGGNPEGAQVLLRLALDAGRREGLRAAMGAAIR